MPSLQSAGRNWQRKREKSSLCDWKKKKSSNESNQNGPEKSAAPKKWWTAETCVLEKNICLSWHAFKSRRRALLYWSRTSDNWDSINFPSLTCHGFYGNWFVLHQHQGFMRRNPKKRNRRVWYKKFTRKEAHRRVYKSWRISLNPFAESELNPMFLTLKIQGMR